MYEHDQVIQAQFQQLSAARAKALGDYEASRLNDDGAGTMDAADRILEADARLQSLNRVAQNFVTGQQQARVRMPGRRVEIENEDGDRMTVQLTDEEVDIARRSLVDRPGIKTSDDDRLRSYATQKKRLADMRASGRYEDRGS